MINNAKDIIRAFDKARSDRTVTENTWEDLLYYGMPRKRGINTKYEPGEKPSWDVYDDTAVNSNLIMAAGLAGYMTNASQRWFELRSRNEALMKSDNVAKFFANAQETIFSTLAASNFYTQIHEIYLDLGSVGNGCLYVDQDPVQDVRFYARHPREIFLVEDDREEVTMVFRHFEMTAYQAYKLFGRDNVGEKIVKCVEEEKDYNKPFKFIHYVCPRYIRAAGKIDAQNKPIASYYVSVDDEKIVREGGYEEMPFQTPRFYKNTGEVYGYGPLYTVYPVVGMINQAVETYIKAVELSMFPPFLAEHDGLMGTLDIRSGAINYQRQPLSQGQAVQPLVTKSNLNVGLDFIGRAEVRIQRAFFVDLFLMLTNNQNMTATEVIERTQEKMLILGPVLGRLQTELLSPLIERVFNVLLRRGKLGDLPQELLQEQRFDVVYVSPLAKAQRAVQAKDMQTFLTLVGQMSQFKPDVLDKIDTDIVVDKMARIYSIDPDIINDEEVIDMIRMQRQKQMQLQQQLLAANSAAGTFNTAAQAQKTINEARVIR